MNTRGGFLDIFRGKAVTIPAMVGALRPNALLDGARVAEEIAAPDNLACVDGEVVFSSAQAVYRLGGPATDKQPELIGRFESGVACLAARPGGGHAVGLDDGEILVCEKGGARLINAAGPDYLKCPTAMTFAGNDKLIVCQGSRRVRPSESTRDLMLRESSGSVWEIDLNSGAHTSLANNLAFPFGVLLSEDNRKIIVSECWENRIIKIDREGRGEIEPVLAELPGYPSRLSAGSDGGAWLCLFAPRNRLIEFILQEHELRSEMIETIEPKYWIAPMLSSGHDFMEPLQKGGVKTMGVHKPWSPSFSWGFLVRLDGALRPVSSFHSRANGSCHGISSICEVGGRIFATSKGNNKILEIDPVQ